MHPCGARTRAAFLEGVTAPALYAGRIAAFVAYLLYFQLLPEKHLPALMADLFGMILSTAKIGAMTWGFAIARRRRVAAVPVKHMDETDPPDRRQDAMVACCLGAVADDLPCLAEAGQPAGQCPRHRGGRPLKA